MAASESAPPLGAAAAAQAAPARPGFMDAQARLELQRATSSRSALNNNLC